MSGSGGFYKYRCKNFLSYNCPNWVWVNNAPCATCLAEGKDADHSQAPVPLIGKEIVVPRVCNGVLQYTLMELVAPREPGESWTLRDKIGQPPPAIPVTSGIPNSRSIVARS